MIDVIAHLDTNEQELDGCLVDNIPLTPMHSLKRGPNVVIHFGKQEVEPFLIDYDTLPSRLDLFIGLLLPFSNIKLPVTPTAVDVLCRSLMVKERVDLLPTSATDYVMRPPIPPGTNPMNFDDHTSVFNASYLWAKSHIERAREEQDPALLSILP